ncbi:hypothetical protein [Campylobacter hominis]
MNFLWCITGLFSVLFIASLIKNIKLNDKIIKKNDEILMLKQNLDEAKDGISSALNALKISNKKNKKLITIVKILKNNKNFEMDNQKWKI